MIPNNRKVYIDLHRLRQRSPVLAEWLCERVGWAKTAPDRVVTLIEGSQTEKELTNRWNRLQKENARRDKRVSEKRQTMLGLS